MALRDWVFGSEQVATATIATVATDGQKQTEGIKDTKPSASPPKAQQSLEVIHWLRPCPVCGGVDFVERKGGGFFCPSCQPTPEESVKRLVRAPGEIVRGLGYGCGKCGNRIYRRVPAGWMCESCGKVFDLIGGSRGPVSVH